VEGSGNHDGSSAGVQPRCEEISHGVREVGVRLIEADDMRIMREAGNVITLWLVDRQAADPAVRTIRER
jgi:hypothetical protein